MTSLQYNHLLSIIRTEVAFWAFLILSALQLEKGYWTDFLSLGIALIILIISVISERSYKKLQEESES